MNHGVPFRFTNRSHRWYGFDSFYGHVGGEVKESKVEQVIEIIRAEPLRVFAAFIIVMAALSVSRNVVDQVKAQINDRKYDSHCARQLDKWGKS